MGGVAHLERIHQRPLGLLLQRRRPPIPELEGAEGAVDGTQGAPSPFLPLDARGHRLAIAEPEPGVMTGGARHGAVG